VGAESASTGSRRARRSLGLLVLLMATRAGALQPVGLGPAHDEYRIAAYAECLEDPERRWTIDDVVRAPLANQFVSHAADTFSFGMTDSAFWLRFALRNDSAERQEWLLGVDWALNDELDLYQRGADGAFTVRRAGDHIAFAQRETADRDPVFTIALEPGTTQTFHVRVAGQDALLVPIVVRTEKALGRHHLAQMTWLVFFYGVCTAMIVYNLVVYFSFRHRGYLFYVLFATCVLFWSLCTEGFVYQYTNPQVANVAVHIFGVGVAMSFLSFARAFLDSQAHTPRLDLPLRIVRVCQALTLPIAFVNVHLFTLLLLCVGFPAIGLMLAISVRRWRQGAIAARLFALACLPFAAGGLLFGVDAIWPLFGSDFVASHMLQIGALLSLVLLPTTLSGRLALFEQLQKRTAELRERTRELGDSEHALAAARDKALAANRAKSTFLANMSHELRTPLNAIIGYGEMLAEDAEEAGLTDYKADLEKIILSGRHLLGLINDVLDLSKIEAGRVELHAEDFDVRELVREVAATVAPLLGRNGNHLEVSVADGADTMHSDLTRLRQILFNLLSNAAKFTKEGSIRMAVERQAVEGADWLEFSITDTGIGMSPEQLGKVFDAFTQAKASTTREYGGTGLGLTITKRFCEMLGGTIDASSELGRGSRFTVRLPAVMPGGDTADGQREASAERAATVMPAPALAEVGKRRVLVIEDDPSARELIQRALEREGYAVRTAADGAEGLRLAHEGRPDAITLDVMMPQMDGWSVLVALKAAPALADVPVIVISIIENRDLGYALGASEYLLKPVERDRLVEVLARYVKPAEDGLVLVVDDEEVMRERLVRAVTEAGYRAVATANGRRALEQIEKRTPQLIVLDLMMPEMDGFELLAALRERTGWAEIPVVVVTAKDLSSAEQAALSGATERVFCKGAYDTTALIAEVNRCLGAARGLVPPESPAGTDPTVPSSPPAVAAGGRRKRGVAL